MTVNSGQPRCTHVAIHARDIDASVSFYETYAELVEVHRRTEDKTTVVWMGERGRESEFVIVLLGMPHADAVDPAPLAHLGYAVGSRAEVDAKADAGSSDGILLAEPRDAGPIVGYFCIVSDPDGNWIEFSFGQSLG